MWCLLTGSEFHAHPYWEWHATVMNDMKGGHMTILLSEDEEKCVEKFGEFGEVVPPTRPCHLRTYRNGIS